MKALLTLMLIVLLIAIALPMAMGEMGDCPMCTSPKALTVGICAAVVSLLGLAVVSGGRRLHHRDGISRILLLVRSVYRPPRSV